MPMSIRQVLPQRLIRTLRHIRRVFTTTVLAYPDALEPGSVLFKICDRLGCRTTQDISARADVIINWEDCSFRRSYVALEDRSRLQKVLNLKCKDISKQKLDEIHRIVFGYGLGIDPLRHTGFCVRKSNENATHDGVVITCPIAELEAGCVYQKEVNNRVDGHYVEDIRVPVFGHIIPFCYLKRRPIGSRFSNENSSASLCEVDSVLSPREVQQTLQLCDAMGLDYGELDVLRDRDDGKLYVVDVNNTPWGPPNHLDGKSVPVALQRLSEAFVSAFIVSNRPHARLQRLLWATQWKRSRLLRIDR